jgi:tetratricopeptide (TPR) repeat protein
MNGHEAGDDVEADDRSRARIAVAVLVVLGAAAYANALKTPFVFDDDGSIAENPSIRRLWPLSEVLFGGTYATVVGRPVLNLSLAVNYALGGTEVLGYHLFNVAVHLLAGLALFGVVRRTLLAPLAPARFAGLATDVAFAVAAVWTLHPLQTESVTYIVQRAESLAGLLVLVCLYCAIRGGVSPRGGRWSVAAVAACLVAAGTKETAAAAPLLVLLHDRAFVAGSFREALRRRPRLYAGLAASWIVLAALVASSQGRAGTAGFSDQVSPWWYAASQPGAICEYLRLCVWPHPLIFDRGVPLVVGAAEVVPYALAVAVLVAATIYALLRRPQVGFVGAWFFLILAPTSSFVPLITQTEAEHRMYLPLAAVVVLVVVAVDAAVATVRPRLADASVFRRIVDNAPAAALAVAVFGFAWGTHRRNETYRSAYVLWKQTAERNPSNERAQLNFAVQLSRAGDARGAIRRLDLALAIDPTNALAHVLRGDLLFRTGHAEEALAEFATTIRLKPLDPAPYNNRGAVLERQARHELALRDFDAAIALAPDYAEAYSNRAWCRLALGMHEKAAEDVAACRRLGLTPEPELVSRVAKATERAPSTGDVK